MLGIVKVVLLVVGLAMVGMVVGYRIVLKALLAVGAGALMLYGLVLGIWLYIGMLGYAWRPVGDLLIVAVAGAVTGLMARWRSGFVMFGLAAATVYVVLQLVLKV